MSTSLELTDTEWTGVAPKYVVSQFIGLAVSAVIVVGITVLPHLFGWSFAWIITGVVVAYFVFEAAVTPRRVKSIGYALRDDDLLFKRGILFRRIVAVPYGRMQLIDINRGPLSRALGLSDLKFVTAAASSGVAIPGIAESDAEQLRDRLVALAESRRAGL
ncbi:PH domain-containing protein [Marisediminicola sp. LYQ134]|uniref:PH domain-containing protein n=1 Tax=unclassified Marisediminicola TaxID=2618316 RepID=UPI0039836517